MQVCKKESWKMWSLALFVSSRTGWHRTEKTEKLKRPKKRKEIRKKSKDVRRLSNLKKGEKNADRNGMKQVERTKQERCKN
jgi:hypothetical protein